MIFQTEIEKTLSRRAFLTRSTTGLGAIALSALLPRNLLGADAAVPPSLKPKGALESLHFAPRARRVIYLFQSGAPSHIDLFDPKPKLTQMTGEELPPSVRMGQRITGMTAGQKALLCVGPAHPFKRYGKNGVELSELLPNIGSIVDDIDNTADVWEQFAEFDPVFAVALEWVRRTDAQQCLLPGGHPGNALAHAHARRKFFAGHLSQFRLRIEQVDVRRGAGLEQVDDPSGLGREVERWQHALGVA